MDMMLMLMLTLPLLLTVDMMLMLSKWKHVLTSPVCFSFQFLSTMSGSEEVPAFATTFGSPVVVRPMGTITVFGLANFFDEAYPARLKGKVRKPPPPIPPHKEDPQWRWQRTRTFQWSVTGGRRRRRKEVD